MTDRLLDDLSFEELLQVLSAFCDAAECGVQKSTNDPLVFAIVLAFRKALTGSGVHFILDATLGTNHVQKRDSLILNCANFEKYRDLPSAHRKGEMIAGDFQEYKRLKWQADRANDEVLPNGPDFIFYAILKAGLDLPSGKTVGEILRRLEDRQN